MVVCADIYPALRPISLTIPTPFGAQLASVFADSTARHASSTAVLNPKDLSMQPRSLSIVFGMPAWLCGGEEVGRAEKRSVAC
jgi:hypothetical protein